MGIYYGHAHRLNLSDQAKSKFMEKFISNLLPPITLYSVNSNNIFFTSEDGQAELLRKAIMRDRNIKEDTKEAREGIPIDGIAFSLNHFQPDMDESGLAGMSYDLMDELNTRGLSVWGFTHSFKQDDKVFNQPILFLPFKTVLFADDDKNLPYTGNDASQLETLLGFLVEKGILDNNNPEHQSLIKDTFPLLTRINVLNLEP